MYCGIEKGCVGFDALIGQHTKRVYGSASFYVEPLVVCMQTRTGG